MKKLFFAVALAIFAVGAAGAQTMKYQGEIDLGYSLGFGKANSDRGNLHTIHGVKIGDYFSTGIGVGFDFYHDLNAAVDIFMPVFLNMKVHVPTSAEKITPFLSVDLGNGFGVSKSVRDYSGLYVTPAVGVMIDRIKIQVGYNVQSLSGENTVRNMDALQIKVGVRF